MRGPRREGRFPPLPLGPLLPPNKQWPIGFTCDSNVPSSFVTSIDFYQSYVRGEVSNICKFRYRQAAADSCRRPLSMRDRLEFSMGAGWRDQVTHALAEKLVRTYRVKCAAEAFTVKE